MELKKACNCLRIHKKDIHTLTDKQIKHKYHLLALKYHPDKNKSSNAKEHFQELQEAYQVICKEKQIKLQKMNYRTLLTQYLSYYIKDSDVIVDLLCRNLNTKIETILEKCSRRRLLLMYKVLYKQKEVLNIPETIINQIEEMIRNKTISIELQCSFKDMWEQKIYVLTHEKNTVYVPLWHETVEYPMQDYVLQVSCKCSDKNVIIDRMNNVHITLTRDQYNDNTYAIPVIGKKKIEQTSICNNKIVLKQQGIPKLNDNNIYDNSDLGDVILLLS